MHSTQEALKKFQLLLLLQQVKRIPYKNFRATGTTPRFATDWQGRTSPGLGFFIKI